MCLYITQEDVDWLKEHRAEVECGIYVKEFHPLGGEVPVLISPLAGPARSMFPGKVYFDQSKAMLRVRNWEDERRALIPKQEYLTGYHAHVKSNLYPAPNFEHIFPVMLAEITAICQHPSIYLLPAIVGRIMLIMTREDYDRFIQDVKTKPIHLNETDYELEAWHA